MKGSPMRRLSTHHLGNIGWFLLVGISTLGVFALAAHADEQAQNRLTGVEVRETDSATEIVVSGSRPPTFTVFKLSDPTRLFVDVSNADASAITEPIEVDNGVIAQITALQFSDDVARVGRIIVGAALALGGMVGWVIRK